MQDDLIKQEILTCGRNPLYFINRYVKIRHPTRGLILFKTFDYQDELVKDYVNDRFNVILKARQLGISEVTAAYATWLMLFHRDKNILVMASKAETAKNIIKKVGTAIKKLPKWLMLADITTDNKLSIELSNGSQVKAIATSEDAGRSEALSLLIIDEAAFVPRFDELWTGLYPTVQAGGRVIVLSTPNGVGNKFHQIYTDAENHENEFKPTKLMWYRHPERVAGLEDNPDRPGFKTSPWYRKEISAANMSARDVAQELECNFNASGETVISGETLTRLNNETVPASLFEHWDRNLHTWWPAEEGTKYLISADVARGDGKDHSAFHVWNIENMEQCAEYYGKIPPEEFAHLLCDIGHRYNDALLVVENNSIGLACLEHIKLSGYPNLYYSFRGDQKTGEAVNTMWGPSKPDMIPGFTMSQRSRPLVVSKLEEYIRNKAVHIRSKRLIGELRTFIWSSGRAEAMRGSNDDLVMSAAIGMWIRDTHLSSHYNSSEMTVKLLEGISMHKMTNNQIAGASKDPAVARLQISMSNNQAQRTTKIRMPGGKEEDFGWLLG